MTFANSFKKRIICSILSFVMIPLGGLISFSDDITVAMREYFEQYKVGRPSNLSVVDKGNDYGVEESGGNKYLRMSVTTDNDIHYDCGFSTVLSGKFIFEFEIMLKDYGNVSKLVQFMDTSRNDIFLCFFAPDGYVKLPDGTKVASYALNKFNHVVMAFDTNKGVMDFYFNGKKRASEYAIALQNASSLRIHMREVADKSEISLDNIYAYSGDKVTDIKTEADTVKIDTNTVMKDAAAMYIGKSSALVNGKKKYTSAERSIIPYEKNGKYMVPVRFFADSIGAALEYDEQDDSTHLSYKNKKLVLKIGEQYCYLNGEKTALGVPCEIGGGASLYAPVDDMCSMLGLFLHAEKNGVIIYSENDMSEILDWQTNTDVMRRICESYMFDDMSGEEMTRLLIEKHPDRHHPRLIMTEEKFSDIRNEVYSPDGDCVYKKIFYSLKKNADRFLEEPTSGYDIRDGIRLLEVCRENSDRIITLAMMYNITQEEKYAQRAYLEMYASACFKDWNPYHFLDVGEMATAMGIGYDWLYNWMDENQRRFIRNAIVSKGIYPIIEDFDDVPRKRSWNWRGALADNWRLVISGIGSCAAMSVVDELEGQDLINAQRAMEQCLIDTRRALSLFSPLGAYEEGPTYWVYTMKYYTLTILALKTGLGNMLGYDDIPGLKFTNKYLMAINGSVNVFNYHDSAANKAIIPPHMMYIADYFGNVTEAKRRLDLIMNTDEQGAEYAYSDMYLYSPKLKAAQSVTGELDEYLPITEIAAMRSGWDKNDTYVGFHCDDPISGEGHDHMDAGTFVMDAMGENFFMDLGADDYNIPNYLQSYRVRAEGHNTVIFNPDADYAQKYGGTAKIVKTEFKNKGGFAIGDMTKAYKDDIGLTSFKRGVKLDSDRNRVIVQDEIKLDKAAEIYWFAHTTADIEISDDKKSAVLTKNGKKLLAKIINGENAEFSVMDAKSLPTSPVIEGQNENKGIRKLTIHIPDSGSINLAVSFVNYDFKYNEARFDDSFIELENWRIEDGDIIEPETAKISSLKVNGKMIEGFKPDKFEYNYIISGDGAGQLNVTAESDHKVTVIQKENITGDVVIRVMPDDKMMYPAEYIVHFNVKPTVSVPEGKNIIKPAKITASDVPEEANGPENTVDSNLLTRWSCPGSCWIEYDLGALKKLDSIGLAFMEGDSRTAQFSIKTSKDGVNYDSFYSGDALSTLQLANYKMYGAEVRYIRIEGRGYNGNPDEYTSITEVAFYEE